MTCKDIAFVFVFCFSTTLFLNITFSVFLTEVPDKNKHYNSDFKQIVHVDIWNSAYTSCSFVFYDITWRISPQAPNTAHISVEK